MTLTPILYSPIKNRVEIKNTRGNVICSAEVMKIL